MERPDEVHLSRQDGEALLKRLQADALTAQDRRVLAQVLQWYFWLVFALQEARFSLKRLRALVLADRALKPTAEPTTWSGVMRPWLLASAARSVGGGACIASRPGSRCVSTATR